MAKHYVKHGQTGTRTYIAWVNMKSRCFNPNTIYFKWYGGRGITVCERWLDFQNFFEDMGHCPDGMTLDRIDNNGNYTPENCRWATHKTQHNNRRRNRHITADGRTQTLQQWCDELGLSSHCLRDRLKRGESILTPRIKAGRPRKDGSNYNKKLAGGVLCQ